MFSEEMGEKKYTYAYNLTLSTGNIAKTGSARNCDAISKQLFVFDSISKMELVYFNRGLYSVIIFCSIQSFKKPFSIFLQTAKNSNSASSFKDR